MDSSSEGADANTSPKRVLVVDDSQDTADTLAQLLECMGHEVSVARDGLQALQEARNFQPDVCLLDIQLPRMDGHEVSRRLRAEHGAERAMRLIALSGYAPLDSTVLPKGSAFDAYLVKPVELDRLLKMISDAPRAAGRPSAGA